MNIIFNNEKAEIVIQNYYLLIKFSCFIVQIRNVGMTLRLMTNEYSEFCEIKSNEILRFKDNHINENVFIEVQRLLDDNKAEIIKRLFDIINQEYNHFKSIYEKHEKEKLRAEEQYGKILIFI
jgi:hypothetical protein